MLVFRDSNINIDFVRTFDEFVFEEIVTLVRAFECNGKLPGRLQ